MPKLRDITNDLNENLTLEQKLEFLNSLEPDYDNPWLFNGHAFKSVHLTIFPKSLEGFVYLITNLQTGKLYIGKKSFWSRRKTKKLRRRQTKESDWKDYYSSSEYLIKDVELLGKQNFKREILYLCGNKKSMTMLEAREQFRNDVIFHPDKYYNMTILGRFFFKDGELVERTTLATNKTTGQINESLKLRNLLDNPAKRPDVKKKMSLAKKGIPLTEEHKQALSKARKGMKFSEQHKLNLSKSIKAALIKKKNEI